MLYRFGKPLVAFTLKQFFSEIRILGARPVENGPLLVVPNHPNAMIDPWLVTTVYDRSLWFIAKSTIFKGRAISSFLRAAHLVPIFRRQDNTGDMQKNDETFRFTSEALGEGKAIVIFPEGMSMGERKLYPLKTGAARMALQAEDARQFALGVSLQPVGITYSEFSDFGSSVTIVVGEPIAAGPFREKFQLNPQEAVRELTEVVDDELRRISVSVEEEQHRGLVEKIAKLYRSRGSELDDRARFDLIAKNVETIAPRLLGRRDVIERRIDNYLSLAAFWSLDGDEKLNQAREYKRALLLSPIVVTGAVLHLVPYRMVGPVVRVLRPHQAFVATYKIAIGLVLFLLWYFVLAVLVTLGTGSIVCGFVTFVATIASGVVANRYFQKLRIAFLSRRTSQAGSPVEVLTRFRDELIVELEELRVV